VVNLDPDRELGIAVTKPPLAFFPATGSSLNSNLMRINGFTVV